MTSSPIRHVIDGRSMPSVDGSVFPTIDPTTRQAWAEVACGGPDDVDRAVRSARAAFDSGGWSGADQADRSAALHRLADLLEQHAGELGELDTTDMGRPIALTTGMDVPRAAANFRFFAADALIAGDDAYAARAGQHLYTRHEPVGVVAAIAPWNFPLMQESWKVAPALAYGNSVVLKPAEQSPASAARLAELAVTAGLPPGVLNVVQGTGEHGAGQALVEHPGVDLITFTGETRTGELIMRSAAAGVRPVSFELGGKGASVVFADADLDRSAAVVADAAFSNAGQVCLAGTRVLVQREVREEFVSRLVTIAEQLRIGDPKQPGTQIGPLASQEHHAKVTGYLDRAAADGARFLTGGALDGWWAAPTVLAGVDLESPVYREEIFGPVVTVHSFDDEADGIRQANDTRYGLSAMLFTQSLDRAHRVAGRLRAGNVWINCFWLRDLRAPFGGFGLSGIGREGGRHSREFFTEPKTIALAYAPGDTEEA
jgi:aminomuconate-semialdehyde/2-hydroxymuconate-6-semialdehyde dehydrogenase